MVEVSVALAEAALHKREGAALLKHHQRRKRQRGDHRRLRSEKTLGNTSSPPGNTAATADTTDEEMVDRCWNDEKAAETERRLAILSKSLEASDIHDLQVLRKSLQREVDDARRALRESKPSRSRGDTTSVGEEETAAALAETADEDERWKAEVRTQRLDAVERAVERKGGWRSAVFLDKNGGEVNVDVDVEPWPAADGVLMLQTVRDALHVQLMEVSDGDQSWSTSGVSLMLRRTSFCAFFAVKIEMTHIRSALLSVFCIFYPRFALDSPARAETTGTRTNSPGQGWRN